MKSFKRSRLVVGALVCGLTASAFGGETAAPTTTAAELQALRAEVAQLRVAQNDNWLNERRAEEVKTLIKEVLSDADTRASLLEGGLTAGYNGKHFFLSSDDGAFLLNIAGQTQIRYIYNNRDNADNDAFNPAADDNVQGFAIARTKIDFSGHIGDPRIGYEIRLAADRTFGVVSAEVVKVDYKLSDSLTLAGGRYKGPFLREELIDSSSQLAVERSLVNEFFTTGYTEGVGVTYSSDMLMASVMINDGAGAGEPPFVAKDFNTTAADFAVTARADVKLAGSWDQWSDFTAWSGTETSAIIGAAVHYQSGQTGDDQTASPGVDQVLSWTVDGSLKSSGWSLYGALIGRHTEGSTGVAGADQYGALVQASYLINDKIEPFVRLEWIDADPGETKLVSFGANYYLRKHNAKFTADVVWALDSVPFNSTLTGLLRDSADEEDQIALRAQFQLLF